MAAPNGTEPTCKTAKLLENSEKMASKTFRRRQRTNIFLLPSARKARIFENMRIRFFPWCVKPILPPSFTAGHTYCCSRSNSHNRFRGHRTGSIHCGAEEHSREKPLKPKVVHEYGIYHSWRNSCLNQKRVKVKSKHVKVESGVSLRCARSMPVHTSHDSHLEKRTIIPLAT